MKRGGPLRRITPLPRSTTGMKRTRLAPVSARKLTENPARARLRAEVLKRDGRCVAADIVPETGCWHPHGEPLDVHELIQRSLWSKGHLDPGNCVAICRRHHEWIDDNIGVAHDRGLLFRSWDRPGNAEQPAP